MNKLEKFIAEQNEIIKKAENLKAKGYSEFFDKMATLHFKTSSDRDVLVEYFVVSMISFFNNNGVDYNITLGDYKNNFEDSLSVEDIINRFRNAIKNASNDIQTYAGDRVYINEDGLLSFPALLYGIQTIVGMRETMQTIFGDKLISEEIFPDLDKVQKRIELVTKMATAIVERRKIDALEGDLLLERAITVDRDIARETKIVEEISSKLRLIEASVKQNKIYTLENHPNYSDLTKELETHIEARDSIMGSLSQSEPAALREYIKLALDFADYEKMYREEQRAQEIEAELEENGLEPAAVINHSEHMIEVAKRELDSLINTKRHVALYNTQVEAVQALIASPTLANFYAEKEELEIATKEREQKQKQLQVTKDNRSAFEKSKEAYEQLGFIAKSLDRGRLLRADILCIPDTDKKIATLEAEVEEALKEEESKREQYKIAEEMYGVLFDTLNGDENHSLAQALGVSCKEELFVLTKDDLLQCHSNSTNALFYEENALKNKTQTEEELQSIIDNNTARLADLALVVEQRERHDDMGDEFFDALELAMSLTTEESDEATNETGHSYTLK